jgi:hypothetical protein
MYVCRGLCNTGLFILLSDKGRSVYYQSCRQVERDIERDIERHIERWRDREIER